MQLRGECKSPGGKLVAVELSMREGAIAAARLSGDFFLHPEPQSRRALEDLAAALLGLPADSDAAALAARLDAALPFGVELLGTSPAAIAVAVRRALGAEESEVALPVERIGSFTEADIEAQFARWKPLPWRLIPERALAPAMNVALDEVLTEGVIAGAAPTLRFWRWSAPAVIVGRCQAIANEVDLEAADARGIQVVRRMTGGGAMFLQPHGAITYSISLPETALAGLSLRQSYEVCDAW